MLAGEHIIITSNSTQTENDPYREKRDKMIDTYDLVSYKNMLVQTEIKQSRSQMIQTEQSGTENLSNGS